MKGNERLRREKAVLEQELISSFPSRAEHIFTATGAVKDQVEEPSTPLRTASDAEIASSTAQGLGGQETSWTEVLNAAG